MINIMNFSSFNCNKQRLLSDDDGGGGGGGGGDDNDNDNSCRISLCNGVSVLQLIYPSIAVFGDYVC